MRKVGIIDYNMGNIRSVWTALKRLECEVFVSAKHDELQQADSLVLPGVGAFEEGIKNLSKLKLAEFLSEQVVGLKKPFLGICLGMQLIADMSYEFGEHKGLGWISGEVNPLPYKGMPLPHIGWNDIQGETDSLLLDGLPLAPDFYFVHSFHFSCANKQNSIAKCHYGVDFTAIVAKDNIFGVQFHPEKSQKAGEVILENFLKLVPMETSV